MALTPPRAVTTTQTQARGRFTLWLWQDGEAPGVSVEGVSFPEVEARPLPVRPPSP